MLRAAGADNVAAQLSDPYPRAAVEWLIAKAPEVILDATEGGVEMQRFWSRWPSLPAVASGRVVAIPATLVTLPGPYPDRALRLLADSIRAAGAAP
jgi:iron complex transport system substrate-binding protein/vitamin B12 transport system substrate-binding protein